LENSLNSIEPAFELADAAIETIGIVQQFARQHVLEIEIGMSAEDRPRITPSMCVGVPHSFFKLASDFRLDFLLI